MKRAFLAMFLLSGVYGLCAMNVKTESKGDAKRTAAVIADHNMLQYIDLELLLTYKASSAWLMVGAAEKYDQNKTEQLLMLALNEASCDQKGEAVKILVEQRANVNARFLAREREGALSRYEGTLLHWAIMQHRDGDETDSIIIKAMLNAGASLYAQDSAGDTVEKSLEKDVAWHIEGAGQGGTEQPLHEKRLLKKRMFLTLIQEHAKKIVAVQSA